MELHSPVVAKKLWNFIRVAFFMMRKGLISKRKLIMDMNLMMKRGKLLGKNLLFHHHHHHHHHRRGGGFGLREYEFSCSNSPNPVFFHVGGGAKRKHHHYFPCISIAAADEADEPSVETLGPVVVVPKIEYSPQYCSYDLAVGEKLSPLLLSPFSVRISNYSDEDEIVGVGAGRQEVDDEAEEFIRRFYEQLKAQSRVALLEYQEMEYQQMLARGMS